jgi:integrase
MEEEKKKPKKPRKGNGEGSIVMIKKGKWKATITIGRDKDGKLIRKVFYGTTKEEAKDKADKYRLDNKAGLLPEDDKITLEQWVKHWIFEYKANSIKKSTLVKYEGIYRNYIKGTKFGLTKLKDLKPSHLQTYYNSLTRDARKSPNTIKTMNKMLKAAFQQAFVEKFIMSNPCMHITLPKVESTTEIQIFTLEEQKQFIKAIEGHRHRVLFLIGFGTGLRIAELIGLRWSDIDMKNCELTVNQTIRREVKVDLKTGEKIKEGTKTEFRITPPKTDKSKRTIPIPSNLIKELKLHQIMQNGERATAGDSYVENGLVFPNALGEPTDARNLTRSYERILTKANIEYKKFHALRHTFATRLFERDVPLKTVSILLGHSDISITADIYTHVMPKEKEKSVDKLNDIFVL